jgi:hypothetical protein
MSVGRVLIITGLALVVVGLSITLGLGRLPGDIRWEGKHGSFYFPIVTCLVISLVLTLVMWIVGRFR